MIMSKIIIKSDVAWHSDNCPTFAVSVMIMKTHVTYLCAAYISLQDFSALRNEKCISQKLHQMETGYEKPDKEACLWVNNITFK